MNINWNEFKAKFHGRTQNAFEDLTYHSVMNSTMAKGFLDIKIKNS